MKENEMRERNSLLSFQEHVQHDMKNEIMLLVDYFVINDDEKK